MTARILDGRALARSIEVAQHVQSAQLQQQLGRQVALGVILVGDDAPSALYVRNKARAAARIGMTSCVVRLPAQVSQAEVVAQVMALNADPAIDAFLVQLPLPKHLDAPAILALINPYKDADGLHPTNVGALVSGAPGPKPCTPAGCLALLEHGGVQLAGADAVVVGRSNIVGKPMALMLLARHATVTVCHAQTQNLAEHLRCADIVVAAVGKPKIISGLWLKAGAAVIDVGINRVLGKLVGDVDFEQAALHVGCITPVPGGVGPMTVAMLLGNCLQSAARFARRGPLG